MIVVLFYYPTDICINCQIAVKLTFFSQYLYSYSQSIYHFIKLSMKITVRCDANKAFNSRSISNFNITCIWRCWKSIFDWFGKFQGIHLSISLLFYVFIIILFICSCHISHRYLKIWKELFIQLRMEIHYTILIRIQLIYIQLLY